MKMSCAPCSCQCRKAATLASIGLSASVPEGREIQAVVLEHHAVQVGDDRAAGPDMAPPILQCADIDQPFDQIGA